MTLHATAPQSRREASQVLAAYQCPTVGPAPFQLLVWALGVDTLRPYLGRWPGLTVSTALGGPGAHRLVNAVSHTLSAPHSAASSNTLHAKKGGAPQPRWCAQPVCASAARLVVRCSGAEPLALATLPRWPMALWQQWLKRQARTGTPARLLRELTVHSAPGRDAELAALLPLTAELMQRFAAPFDRGAAPAPALNPSPLINRFSVGVFS